jgi:predicted dehydrogenase
MTATKLRWGILSTGKIAHRFAEALSKSSSGQLVAVASRTLEDSAQFAEQHNVPHAHADYAALLENPEVDAVYIAPPHPMHREWAIRCAEAGKHILCEKPAGMNRAEVEEMIGAARKHGVFFMEAFMYRCHPQTETLRKLIRSDEIGPIRMIHATFSYYLGEYDRHHRLVARALGGGSILDIGCYGVSMARMVAGEVLGKRYAEPEEVRGFARLEPGEKTDLTAAAILRFPGGLIAMIQSGLQLHGTNEVRLEGELGTITLNRPWGVYPEEAEIRIHNHKGGETRTLRSGTPDHDLYGFEIDAVARAVAEGRQQTTEMDWEDSLGNAAVLDAWLAEAGVSYCRSV